MTDEQDLVVRPPREDERAWIERYLRQAWGSTIVVSRGRAHEADKLPALLATSRDEIVGLATFRLDCGECEIVTLDALHKGQGIGSALLAAVRAQAAEHGSRRLWLITTNDNIDAIRFYQRRGMRLVALHVGAVDDSRRIKPSIPEIGDHGIQVHDELEFELRLD